MTSLSGDPIDDVIQLLRPRTVLSASLRAHGRWSVRFDAFPHVKFGTVAAGSCRIALQGRRKPVQCEAGDVYILGNPPTYAMASDLAAPSRAASTLFRGAAPGSTVTIGREGRGVLTHIVGGHFVFDSETAHLIDNALPALLHVRALDAHPLRELAGLLTRELAEPKPGRGLALDQLTRLILVHAMRSVDPGARQRAGWLGALADPQIGIALRRIHADPKARYSLQELAQACGMSRSAFFERFKQLVGRPPLDYAIAWRMDLARDALRHGDRPIGELAFALGYESESAFSTAFRRANGAAPRSYRQRARV